MKLKHDELAGYREELLGSQQGICPLCGRAIEIAQSALDHDHRTGHVRATLHRSCNHAEGMVKNWAKRSNATTPEEFLEKVLAYWKEDFSHQPLHPSFKTATDKRIMVLKKKLKKGGKPVYVRKWEAELSELKKLR